MVNVGARLERGTVFAHKALRVCFWAKPGHGLMIMWAVLFVCTAQCGRIVYNA